MFITLNQKIKCSECGSVNNYESFSDARYSGTRCLTCGHEKKELHEHLKPHQSGGMIYQQSQIEVEF